MSMHKEVLIIGAGQCGMAIGRFLQKKATDFLILEKNNQVGDNWKKRYNSLQLFTPAAYSGLPDLPLGISPKTRPNKDQIADYFDRYAEHFELPVFLRHEVSSITKEGELFTVVTTQQSFTANKVVIASGFCERPQLPEWADRLAIPYIHSAGYKNPVSIKGNKVLVVGGGNSAAQIAAELVKYFEVHWSTRKKPSFFPLHLFGKNVLVLADKLGKLDKPVSEKKLKKGEPIYRYGDLTKLLKKVKRKKDVVKVAGNKLTFAFGGSETYDFVLFATGFKPNFDFIQITGFENDLEQLRDQHGISQIRGLYFLGIPYQRSRSSQLISGSQKDALFMVEKLMSPIQT